MSARLYLQVRAREMEYEIRQANRLREKKEKRNHKLLHVLKELWREEREAEMAALAEECSLALRCIGQGHAAATLVMQNQEARNVERARQVEVNQHREASRYKIALQKERLQRKLESRPKTVAKRRKKVKDSAAQWERSLGRFSSHNANFKLLSRTFSSDMPCGWFSEHKEDLSLLQPSDYKHTFLHSRLFIDGEDASVPEYNDIDAWKAAEVQRQIMTSYKIMQMEIKDVMNKRKVLRGQLAGSKLMIEQKLQLLEQENSVIERAEKKDKRNTLRHQNADVLSKVRLQGFDEPILDLPQNLNANSSTSLAETSSKVGEASDNKVNEGISQGLKLAYDVICVKGQAIPIATSGENVQEDQKIAGGEGEEEDISTALLSCKENIQESNCSDLSNVVTERAFQGKKSKLSSKYFWCKTDKTVEKGEKTLQRTSAHKTLPLNCKPYKKESASRGIQIRRTSSGEAKTVENNRVMVHIRNQVVS